MSDEIRAPRPLGPAPNASTPVRRSLSVWLQWLLLRAFCPEIGITRDEVRARSYQAPPEPLVQAVTERSGAEPILELAKDLYHDEEQRLGSVHDKARTLAAVCALLLPLISAFLPRLAVPALGCLPLLFILAAVLLLLINFGISTRSRPVIDQELLSNNEPGAAIAASYLHAMHLNSYATDFLCDAYKGARRALAAGLVILVLIAAALPWAARSSADASARTSAPSGPLVHILVGSGGQVVTYSATQPTTGPAPRP